MVISVADAKDVMCTAVESGIGYWINEECEKVTVNSNTKLTDETLDTFFYTDVAFTYEGKEYKVTVEDLIIASPAFTAEYPHLPIESMTHDSISADALFQFAAFNGKIIFG